MSGNKNPFFGKRHTEETKEKIRNKALGHKRCVGRILSLKTREKIRLSQTGERNSNWGKRGSNTTGWKGGKTNPNLILRSSREYNIWRSTVFIRDNYTCQFCLKRGGKLQADHIRPFRLFPELRLDINNGRTLCITCHRKTPTYGNSNKTFQLEFL